MHLLTHDSMTVYSFEHNCHWVA